MIWLSWNCSILFDDDSTKFEPLRTSARVNETGEQHSKIHDKRNQDIWSIRARMRFNSARMVPFLSLLNKFVGFLPFLKALEGLVLGFIMFTLSEWGILVAEICDSTFRLNSTWSHKPTRNEISLVVIESENFSSTEIVESWYWQTECAKLISLDS